MKVGSNQLKHQTFTSKPNLNIQTENGANNFLMFTINILFTVCMDTFSMAFILDET